jgi:C4-dicarboxylate-specific signal transduction histidine kinase
MLHRSDHLQQFVESYRKLAMLPTPNKQKVALSSWIESALLVMSPLFKTEKITVKNTITFDRWLSIDLQQMEQVLINLLTNSMYALQNSISKEIIISAEVKEKRIFITITDFGLGVEKEIEDKIFLPFFTTRKEGAGIGLTLSKSIVEAHGGYLVYQKSETTTRFMICLIE